MGLLCGIGKTVRDSSLTCGVGFQWVPLAFLIIALLTFPFTALQLRLMGRWGYPRWHRRSTYFIASSFFLFWGLCYFLSSTSLAMPELRAPALRGVYLAFYIWMAIVLTFLNTNLLGHVRQVYPDLRQERGMDYARTALLVGTILGSWLVGKYAVWMREAFGLSLERSRDIWMLGMGVVLFLQVPFLKQPIGDGGNAHDGFGEQPSRPKGEMGLNRVWERLKQDLHFRRVAPFILVANMAPVLLTYIFYWVVTERTGAQQARIDFFSGFYFWLSVFVLFMTAVGTDRLIRKVGLKNTLLLHPLLLLAGSLLLLFKMELLLLAAVKLLEAALQDSIHWSAINRLCLQVEPGRSNFIHSVLVGLVIRLGEGLAGILLLALNSTLEVSFQTTLAVWIFALLIWIAFVFMLQEKPSSREAA